MKHKLGLVHSFFSLHPSIYTSLSPNALASKRRSLCDELSPKSNIDNKAYTVVLPIAKQRAVALEVIWKQLGSLLQVQLKRRNNN